LFGSARIGAANECSQQQRVEESESIYLLRFD
jgi:hypothetical protein